MERLRAMPMFADLSARSLQRVAKLMMEFQAPKGQILIERGMPGSGLFVIQEGVVVVEVPRTRAWELGPGEVVGELALLTEEGLRTARVRAKTAVKCLALSRRDFMRLLREEPKIAVAMLPILAKRLAATTI
jgi:CRP-like cAMP-binding protein